MSKVKFVSYDGAYPNLCSGTLVLEIDGKKVSFGYSYKAPVDYPSFWCTGGSVRFDEDWIEDVSHGEWELSANEREYPKEIFELLPECIKVMNENVPEGCCGGCV